VTDRLFVAHGLVALVLEQHLVNHGLKAQSVLAEDQDAGLGIMMGMFLRDLDEKEVAQRSFRLFIDEVLPRFQSGPRDPYEGLIPAAHPAK